MADMTYEQINQSRRAWRNWSNEVQYRRADFEDPAITGDIPIATLGAGTFILRVKIYGGARLVRTPPDGEFLEEDTEIIARITGGTQDNPQGLVIAYIPKTVSDLGFNAG